MGDLGISELELADEDWFIAGREGAPPKEGMSAALEDTKKAASDAAAGQSL